MPRGCRFFITASVIAGVVSLLATPTHAQPVRSFEFRILSDRTLEQNGQRFSIFQSIETSVRVFPDGLSEQTVFRNFRTLAGRGGGRVVRTFERQFPQVSSGVYRLPNGEWQITATGAARVAALEEGARRITITFESGGRCRARLAAARENGRGDVRARSFIDGGPVRIVSEQPVESYCRYSR